MTAPYEKVLVHVRIAESAQPRKASNVTRPFPIIWVRSGDEIRQLADCMVAHVYDRKGELLC